MQKAQTNRDLDGAKRRHRELMETLNDREEALRRVAEAPYAAPPRERIRDRRKRDDADPDSVLTPRQLQLVSESPPRNQPKLVCRHTQVLQQQRRGETLPSPGKATAPLHAAKSPRLPRTLVPEGSSSRGLLATDRGPAKFIPDRAPQAVKAERERIEGEIERLRGELQTLYAHDTMFEAVEQLQVSLMTVDRTHGRTDRWHHTQPPAQAEGEEEAEGAEGREAGETSRDHWRDLGDADGTSVAALRRAPQQPRFVDRSKVDA